MLETYRTLRAHASAPALPVLSLHPMLAFAVITLACLDTIFILGTTTVSLTGSIGGSPMLTRALSLQEESNLATWYSGSQLLIAALLALANALAIRRPGCRSERLGWLGAGLLLLYLSADEIAQIHESQEIGPGVVVGLLHWADTPIYAWMIVYLPLIAAAAAFLGWFVVRCTQRSPASRWLTLAALGCWAGTLIAEALELPILRWIGTQGLESPIEEGLEVVGATLLVLAFGLMLRSSPGAPTRRGAASRPGRRGRRTA
ncbi:MAG: hypothetical protein HY331_12195 [Chloroflexi bacterium]|nr:hypothetical protein [Chloroflexota bacterium]